MGLLFSLQMAATTKTKRSKEHHVRGLKEGLKRIGMMSLQGNCLVNQSSTSQFLPYKHL